MHVIFLALATVLTLQDAPPPPGNWDPTNPEDVARRTSDPAQPSQTDDPLKGPSVPAQTDDRRGRTGGAMMTAVTVESILQANCASCHAGDKQKGGLEVLPISRLHEGPEKFRVVKPGDPAGSLLVQRIKLPAGHDDVMPPSDKVLTPDQIKVIEDWVRDGATEADAKKPIAGMSAMTSGRGGQQKTSAREFLRAYMALPSLTKEQRAAGINAAAEARKSLSPEDKQALADFNAFRRAIGEGEEIPQDIAERRQELMSKAKELQARAAKAQQDLWNLLTTEQQAQLRARLDKAAEEAAKRRQQGRRGADRRGGQRGGTQPPSTD